MFGRVLVHVHDAETESLDAHFRGSSHDFLDVGETGHPGDNRVDSYGDGLGVEPHLDILTDPVEEIIVLHDSRLPLRAAEGCDGEVNQFGNLRLEEALHRETIVLRDEVQTSEVLSGESRIDNTAVLAETLDLLDILAALDYVDDLLHVKCRIRMLRGCKDPRDTSDPVLVP